MCALAGILTSLSFCFITSIVMAKPPSISTDPNASRQNSNGKQIIWLQVNRVPIDSPSSEYVLTVPSLTADWSYEGSLKASASLPTASAFYSFQHYSALADFHSKSIQDPRPYEPRKSSALAEPKMRTLQPPFTATSQMARYKRSALVTRQSY